MRLMYYVTCVALGLCLVSCSGSGGNDKKQAETIASDCIKAMAESDREALRTLMTAQMYTDYVSAINLLLSYGKKVPDFSEIELISASCDRIEGDNAYVNVETRIGEKSQFEILALKKEDGNWKVAGKQ